jgi:hypothetical protein
MITFAFVVLLLFLLRRYREHRDRRWLYPIPPIFVACVNLHAGFTVGLAFLVIYILGEAITRLTRGRTEAAPLRPMVVTGVLSISAAAINPNFFKLFFYAAQTQFSPAQQRLIVEWFSPDFHKLAEVGAFEAMLLLVIVLLALSTRRPRPTDLLLLLTGIVLALQSVRHIALFVAVATPVLAELGQDLWRAARERGARLRQPVSTGLTGAINVAVALAVVLVLVAVKAPAVTAGPRSEAVAKEFPVAAMDAIVSDPPPGRVFNAYGWGGYYVYRLWPARQVYIYGDAAVMGDRFLSEYESVENLHPDYLAILDRRGVSWVIDHSNAPLVSVLQHAPDWVVVHRDSLATVLVRRGPLTDAYINARPG